MKKVFYFFIALVIIFHNSLFAQNSRSNSYIKIDKLEAFWRFQPVIGRWLSRGQGMIVIPDYMEGTSFPYVKHLYDKEVPFADSLNVVRLLGGWDYTKKRGELSGQKNADLVYVDNGKLRYRWNLLKGRLDPYINAGYENLTLVLDNIPWDLPKKSKLKAYGQVNPPTNLKVWETFLEAMIQEMVRLYGYDTVKNFRFRLGTECQTKVRFNGTHKEYVNLYLSTQRAIEKILPDAKIAPFNLAGRKTQLHKNNVDMKRFMSLIAIESNVSKLHVDFLPVSTYYVVRKKHKKNIKQLLDARTEANRRYFDILFDTSQKIFTKEIHEFGVLNNSLEGVRSGEPGVRGAAWRMYMIQNMMENNISKLYHWGTFDRVSKDKYLLKGNGWNYSILEYLAGGEVYSLPVVTKKSTHQKTLVVIKNKKVYILTAIFPDEKDRKELQDTTVSIPLEILPSFQVSNIKWTYLTSKTSVLDVIHDDFISNNLLEYNFSKDLNIVASVKNMGGYAGKKYVLEHWSRYKNIIVDSLTLKPYAGQIKKKDKILELNFTTEVPSVNLIVLDWE